MNKTGVYILVLVILINLTSSSSVPNAENPFSKDLFEMEGVKVEHQIQNSAERLSNNEIIELQDDSGLTIWFARFFFKDICVTGLCNMAKFWMFWDGAGNYLTFRLNDNEPLTKSEHIDFLNEDYMRLDEILHDTSSILQDFDYGDLEFETNEKSIEDNSIYSVDGYSSATSLELSEYVVKDAVFTCYTLWHTVYGETREEIRRILNSRADSNYIQKLLNGNSKQRVFALELIESDNTFFHTFEEQLLGIVTSGDSDLSKQVISIIPSKYLMNRDNQIKFIELIDNARPEIKFEIIYKLQLLDTISTDAILLLLNKHTEGLISVGGLNQVYRIISKQENKKGPEFEVIKQRLIELSRSSILETSHLTTNFLRSLP